MIGVFDVGYSGDRATVGCVTLEAFGESEPLRQWVVSTECSEEYTPGAFYRRELQPLLVALQSSPELSVCVVDAFVDLGEDRTPGLGRILFEQTGVPVIGVAKSRYPGTPPDLEVLRGASRCPLFVSAAGLDDELARDSVRAMAGAGRIPSMLRLADRLARQGVDV
ncbi:MAG: endonuclease V [Actinomycetota bacterium]